MDRIGIYRSGISGCLLALALVASGAARAQASSVPAMPTEPLDASGQPCGALRALPADVTHYRYEVTNHCARKVTFFWRCNAADTEHTLDVPAQGRQTAQCVKASGTAGEIVFRFDPPGTGN